RQTRWPRAWSSDVCSSDLGAALPAAVSLLDHAALGCGHRTRRGALMRPHTSTAPAAPSAEDPRRRRIRRSALLFALIAAAFYFRSEERRVGKEWRCWLEP